MSDSDDEIALFSAPSKTNSVKTTELQNNQEKITNNTNNGAKGNTVTKQELEDFVTELELQDEEQPDDQTDEIEGNASEPHREINSFDDMPEIPQWLKTALAGLGVDRPTQIQRHTLPATIGGRDVIGCAQTGSGKTLCFAIPSLVDWSREPYGPHTLVLTPTRELAAQIGDVFRALGASVHLRVQVMVGGSDQIEEQLNLLYKVPHVIVATPGRLAYCLQQQGTQSSTLLSLKRIRFVILDEADRLLSRDFVQELPVILREVPAKRQTLLFSATMTKNLAKLGQLSLNKPFRYDTTVNFETVATLRQEYLFMPQTVKDCYLAFVLDQFVQTSDKTASCVVFVANKVICELLSEMLNELSLPVVSLHSQKSQVKRTEAISLFKSGVKRIMIATDLASRGLDIGHVALVVNHNIPRSYRDYLHRVGRTARKGRQGRAISLVSQYEVTLLQYIEGKLGRKLDEYAHEEKQVLKYLNPALKAFQVARLRLDESGFFERHRELKQRRIEQRREQEKSGGTVPVEEWSEDEEDMALGHVLNHDTAALTRVNNDTEEDTAPHATDSTNAKKRKRDDEPENSRKHKVSKSGAEKFNASTADFPKTAQTGNKSVKNNSRKNANNSSQPKKFRK
eukprot:TRINITY_DN14369_c0_g1_i1.p1 TRINITY_DN14369_c0_g1~~TRINITY_DN14369_c0_g1_i1.p1  ORF type:complete len:625 (-),score=226.12 TRINITY_DN14369_c0_g1_i1:42-1916(-)